MRFRLSPAARHFQSHLRLTPGVARQRCPLDFDEPLNLEWYHEVTYLLDTNVWLFGYLEPEVLPEEIQRILDTRDVQLGLSAISVWEAATPLEALPYSVAKH